MYARTFSVNRRERCNLNKRRRFALQSAINQLSIAIDSASDVMEEERMMLDNVPDNLREAERFSSMEDGIDDMRDAIDDMKSARSTLSCIIQ